MDPNAVRFSQRSISFYFADGRTIDDLAEGLRSGRIRPEDIPPLRLVEKEGLFFTLDNRRLEAFRRAGVDIPWRLTTPEELAREAWKFTTTNQGVSVKVRGQPQ
jgi:hypothetical protein